LSEKALPCPISCLSHTFIFSQDKKMTFF